MRRSDAPPRPTAGGIDKIYFDSYAHLSIHEEMIKDRVRTDTYRRAILNNAADFRGKVVLDVGAGTGILSFFCVQAGASKVYAVEASDLADMVREVVEHNKVADKIIVIKAKVEEVQLPEQIDIILSEWMGYALLYVCGITSPVLRDLVSHSISQESMFDSVIWARKNLGKKNCRMLPSSATVHLALLTDEEIYTDKIDFWKNVYGIDMSSLIPYAKKCAFEEPQVEGITGENVMSFPVTILNVDCNTVEPIQSFEAEFTFSSMLNAPMHGFALWFDVAFESSSPTTTATPPIVLSTAPEKPSTHWKQTLFYLNEPIALQQDDVVKGRIVFAKNATNNRCVDHTISFAVNGQAEITKVFQMK